VVVLLDAIIRSEELPLAIRHHCGQPIIRATSICDNG
jgi:hypothetical protein